MKKIFLTMLMAVAFVAAKAVTATIYVQAEEAPYLYGWFTVNAKETKINGPWPGTQMTESVTKVNKNGESITFWSQTFTFENTSSFNIIFNNGDNAMMKQTGNITNISSDRYFTYDGATKYTDITEDFNVEIPDVEVQSVALLSELNGWDGLAQVFSVVEANAKYTYNLDLTNVDMSEVEDYYRFKIMVNSSAYLDWYNLTLDDPNEWMEEDIALGGGNIGIDISQLEVRAILFTATFAGGKDIYQGWTLKAELGSPMTGISGIADNVTKQPVTRYNLSGQQVGKDYRGIMIVNGKKVLKH